MAGWTDFLPIIGSVLGAGASGDKTQTATQTKAPWEPAQPYILRDLQRNNELADQYAKQPFNAMQIQGYKDLFGDIGNFRNNIAPGLMDFANRGMNSSYSANRGPVGSGYQGGRQGGYGSPQQVNQKGAFSVAPSMGVSDMNLGIPVDTPPVQVAPVAPVSNAKAPVVEPGQGEGGLNPNGSQQTASPETLAALDQGIQGLMGIGPGGIVSGLLGGVSDTIGGLFGGGTAKGIDGTTSAMSGGFGSGETAAEALGNEGGYGFSSGETEGSAESLGGDNYAKGGKVKKKGLVGPNPKGPDEGKANLQSGEYVIKKKTVNKYGDKVMKAINEGSIPASKIKGLLA